MKYEYSILIPTHNRHEKLGRLLSYLSNFLVRVVVVDSSENPAKIMGDSRVRYFHKPELNFKQKVIFGAEILNSDYIFLSADDDFPLLGKLENVLGRVGINFSLLIGSVGVFNESFDGTYSLQGDKSETGVFTQTNVVRFLGNYSQVLWGLYSRNSMIDVFRLIDECEFENDNYIELVIAPFMASERSLIKVSDVFYVREISTGEHWGSRHETLRETYLTRKQQFLSDFVKYGNLFNGDNAAKYIAAYLGHSPRRASSLDLFRMKFKRLVPVAVQRLIKRVLGAPTTPLAADSSLDAVSEAIIAHTESGRDA